MTFDRQLVEDLCLAIIREGLDEIPKSCKARPDEVDPQLLSLMARAGFKRIAFGVESFDAGVLQFIKKGITPAQIKCALQATLAAGIRPGLNLIFFSPPETLGSLGKTMESALVYVGRGAYLSIVDRMDVDFCDWMVQFKPAGVVFDEVYAPGMRGPFRIPLFARLLDEEMENLRGRILQERDAFVAKLQGRPDVNYVSIAVHSLALIRSAYVVLGKSADEIARIDELINWTMQRESMARPQHLQINLAVCGPGIDRKTPQLRWEDVVTVISEVRPRTVELIGGVSFLGTSAILQELARQQIVVVPKEVGPELLEGASVLLWDQVYIEGDGRVFPGVQFSGELMGNVLHESLLAIWQGTRFRRFREALPTCGLRISDQNWSGRMVLALSTDSFAQAPDDVFYHPSRQTARVRESSIWERDLLGRTVQLAKRPNVFYSRGSIAFLLSSIYSYLTLDSEVCDMGTGPGIVGIAISPLVKKVTAVDVSAAAVEAAGNNAQLNQAHNLEVIRSDLFCDLGERSFDFIVFNPPFSVTPPEIEARYRGNFLYLAIEGGWDGLVVVRRFLRGAPKHLRPAGKIFMIIPDFGTLPRLFDYMRDLGLSPREIARETRQIPKEDIWRVELARRQFMSEHLDVAFREDDCFFWFDRVVIEGGKANF